MFTLIIEDQDGNIADEYSFEDGEFIVGRSHSSDIILPSDNVSRRHARLFTRDGRCYVEDLASSNGVFVDGSRIHRVTEVPLSGQVKVGDYYLHVEGARATDIPDPVSASTPAVAVEQSSAHGGSQFVIARLVGSSPSIRGQVFDVTRAVSLVGRGKDCAITVIDASISRIHGKLVRNQDGSITVEDLRSANGTYVNDQRVEQATFGHGDRLRFGNIEFVVELPGYGDVEHIEVSSGGRRWAVAAVALLASSLIIGGIVVGFSDESPSEVIPPEVTDSEVKPTNTSDEIADAEERELRYERAGEKLESIVKRAAKLAAQDKWQAAEALLLEGKAFLDEVAAIDTKGELTARFEASETELRTARAEYKRLVSSLAARDYVSVGRRYKEIVQQKGPFATAAADAIAPEKLRLVNSGDALCGEKVYGKCLDYYQKAKTLDPLDQNVAQKVRELRLKILSETD